MGVFRNFPYSNFHEMNLDWLINQINFLKEEWTKFSVNWSTELKNKVDEWLTNHPEYMTTVEDDSITSIKLHNESIPFYNVADYGIVPSNHDNYDEIHNLFSTKVFYTGGIVFFPKGRYIISDTLFIPENTTIIGEGELTEIYFDESYTYYGVGLSNAGSNVSILNIKVTQKTKGTFHSGAQPGCIGFSTNHREMGNQSPHTTLFLRSDVSNLTAKNIFSDDSCYVIQTENDSEHTITNVIYENINTPNSCVSVMTSEKEIANLSIKNIICDAFRISYNNANGGVYKNAIISNITCQTPIFNSPNSIGTIIINNLIQTTNTRKNDLLPNSTYSGIIDGNIEFNHCIFNAIENETSGLSFYNGIRSFYNCIFNAVNKICTRNVALQTDSNYENIEHCELNCGNANATTLIGYGTDNKYNGVFNNMLWGDTFKMINMLKLTTGPASVTSTVEGTIKVQNNRIILQCYIIIENTNNILTLNELGMTLLNRATRNEFLVNIFNSVTPYDNVVAYASFENGNTLKIREVSFADRTDYNRCKISTELTLTRKPNPVEIYNLLS